MSAKSKQSPDRSRRLLQFRVIAGNLKGRLITAPDLGITRPPLTRLRRAIFDFLSPYLPGATYLDLFSGTGSYLFEAISRGVPSATGVELEPQLAEAINRQAVDLGVQDRLRCIQADVLKTVPRLCEEGKRFDVIMMAPPQYKGLIDETLKSLSENQLLAQDGIVLCQHDSSETEKINFLAVGGNSSESAPDCKNPFRLLQRRKYGNTTFTVLG